MQPKDYNLPHDDFRPGQSDAISWCLDLEGVGIAEAPTGSGKTALAKAVSSQKSVVALCRTKNLQQENYGDTYDFDILFGKSNYPCCHPDAAPSATAGDCLHQDNMYQCALASSCEYLQQKRLVKGSPKASLNYAYWMTAKSFRNNPPQVLFLDEVHELPDVVTSFVGCTITQRDKVEWRLAEFPELKPARGGGMFVKVADPLPAALSWLHDARQVLRRHWKDLEKASTKSQLKKKRKCERLGMKVSKTIDALQSCADDWYIRSGRDAQQYGREKRPAFICKPLTAKHHAPGYFLNGHATVAMSATVGDFAAFTKELGIVEYDSLIIPNQYSASERPVYVLDCPGMGSKASNLSFEKQADEIASAILDCPNDWSGFVHVTRKKESKLLADRLARRGLQDRVWIPPGYDGEYTPTDQQAREWQVRKLRVSNSICVSWSFWTGFDGLDEKICIAAKVPFPVWGSGGSYEAAWRSYSMGRYRWSAANTLAQGLGRTRRGREQDYDIDGGFNGFVAIGDKSHGQIKKSLPKDVRDALVEL